ncbi:methylmalonyl Co-A mutase-associated GTPase MeaB [Gracilimonas sediminicola]|uniref:Methylmalonyl Co-A mutase-associated GTPase MeaB n=1 Tax=Gracilimonas sediminicola TaxID=2952158 RepID=A0A9X2RCV2_9BACT|nr:methylmalonyl Co-A mutase-associated GTPase MeaB [Gracilimonas sediminicola]MCP9291025.1 methylmalonyl Co-A mutase-associated GTPase MeaB [Gracilimonas sediminicola]
MSRQLPPAAEFIEGILDGDRMLLSRAITLIESTKQEHQELAQEIIEGCLPHSGDSVRIGITGVPGVGKSTFIESFGNYVIDEQERNLAVLAVDPSSSKTRGSILGDKTRMETLSNHPNAYIRPTPTSGSLGGVARSTRETITLCEAAGFDTILIETVGVGQSETAVHSMVDFFLLLMLAGAGDELQGIKRGIMEMADSIVINKADSGNEDAAKRALAEYKNALHLFPPTESGWIPKVTTCSAFHNKGIPEVWEIVDEYVRHTKAKGYFEQQRKEQANYWLNESIHQELHQAFYGDADLKSKLEAYRQQVQEGKISSYKAAKDLMKEFLER